MCIETFPGFAILRFGDVIRRVQTRCKSICAVWIVRAISRKLCGGSVRASHGDRNNLPWIISSYPRQCGILVRRANNCVYQTPSRRLRAHRESHLHESNFMSLRCICKVQAASQVASTKPPVHIRRPPQLSVKYPGSNQSSFCSVSLFWPGVFVMPAANLL